MSRRDSRTASIISWVLAIAVHLVLAAILFWSLEWRRVPPAPLSVDLVAPIALSSERAHSPQPGTGEMAAAKPASGEPKPEPKPEPKHGPPPPVKPELAVKEAKVLEPKAEPKPAPPEPRRPEPKPEPKKPEPKPEPKTKPEPKPEPPVKEEDFARRAQERLKQPSAPAQDPIAERLQALAQGRGGGAPTGPSEAAKASYIDAIRAKVRQHVVVPPGVTGNPEAVFDVTQLPDGTVVEVRLVRSSGIAALDQALDRAIRAASPLPTPSDSRLFERQLRLILRPLAQ